MHAHMHTGHTNTHTEYTCTHTHTHTYSFQGPQQYCGSQAMAVTHHQHQYNDPPVAVTPVHVREEYT